MTETEPYLVKEFPFVLRSQILKKDFNFHLLFLMILDEDTVMSGVDGKVRKIVDTENFNKTNIAPFILFYYKGNFGGGSDAKKVIELLKNSTPSYSFDVDNTKIYCTYPVSEEALSIVEKKLKKSKKIESRLLFVN